MSRCTWQFHGVSRRENGDGTVTLTVGGWRYTSNTERDPGDASTCRWCLLPIRRTVGHTWREAVSGEHCAASGPDGFHSPEPLPAVVHAPVPCLTRTVPARFSGWDGEQVRVIESGDAAEMVTEHVGEPYTPVWQGRGWTVEIRSGYALWQVTS